VKHFVARRSALGRRSPREGRRWRRLHGRAAKTLALVGESGSGKSTVGRLVLRLIEPTAGRMRFDGQDVFALSEAARAPSAAGATRVPGPYASLNPRMTVGDILAEPLALHTSSGRRGGANASPNCSTWSGCSRASRRAIRTSSPAGSASAS
jgi:peptide/nickel transport system ATP-binding protein/oligopeptide transport system ATP-binding protein